VSDPRAPYHELCARRRPGMVFAVYALEAIAAWVLAAPWAEGVARIFGGHPDGDRALFWQAGHIDLVDVISRHRQMIGALVGASAIGLCVWFVVAMFPLGALLGALYDRGTFGIRRAALRGGELFSRLALVQLATLVMMVVGVLMISVLPNAMLSARLSSWEPRKAAMVQVGFVFVALSVIAVGCAIGDLARALIARHEMRAGGALGAALRSPRVVLSLVGLSLPRWFASLGALGVGAAFSTRSSSILAILLVHQAIALARVGLRASVLARALRLSDVVLVAIAGPTSSLITASPANMAKER
jgi:hypothetical protein